jgi:hypothetical protein
MAMVSRLHIAAQQTSGDVVMKYRGLQQGLQHSKQQHGMREASVLNMYGILVSAATAKATLTKIATVALQGSCTCHCPRKSLTV